MPNLRGPGESRRRLYATVVQSVLYYGAPIWAERAVGDAFITKIVRRALRALAIRVVCGYATVSYEVSTLLATVMQFEIGARRMADAYRRFREVRDSGVVRLG